MSLCKILTRAAIPAMLPFALPTLDGETVLQLAATPLVAAIMAVDLYDVVSRVRLEAALTYEPLLLLGATCLLPIIGLVILFRYFEPCIPARDA